MTEVLNFTVNKCLGCNNYRIVTEFKRGTFVFYLQHEVIQNGSEKYVHMSDEYWVSLDALLASAKFQNLFK